MKTLICLILFIATSHSAFGSTYECSDIFEVRSLLGRVADFVAADFAPPARQTKYPMIAMKTGMSRSDRSTRVAYISAELLPRYEIVFDGTVWKYKRGQLLGDGVYYYHMNGDGQIFALPETDELVRYQHSSLPAGGKTSGVGFIEFKDGEMKSIDRCSGHYKPSVEIFKNVLRELEERGQNIRAVTLGIEC